MIGKKLFPVLAAGIILILLGCSGSGSPTIPGIDGHGSSFTPGTEGKSGSQNL